MGAGFFPVKNSFNVLVGDAEAIAVPDSALEQDFNTNRQVGDTLVVKFSQIEIPVVFLPDCDLGQEGLVRIFMVLVHQKYQNYISSSKICKRQLNIIVNSITVHLLFFSARKRKTL